MFSFKDVTIFMIFNRVNKYSMNVEKSSKSSCVHKIIRDFIWFASLLSADSAFFFLSFSFSFFFFFGSESLILDLVFAAEWWSIYGGGCPNLARLSARILSQTCSLIRCKQNQIPVEQLHATKNNLEHQRLSDLAFVRTNFWLRHR